MSRTTTIKQASFTRSQVSIYFSSDFVKSDDRWMMFSVLDHSEVYCPLNGYFCTIRGGVRTYEKSNLEVYCILPDGKMWLRGQARQVPVTGILSRLEERGLWTSPAVGGWLLTREYQTEVFAKKYPLFNLVDYKSDGIFCPFVNKGGKFLVDVIRCCRVGKHIYYILPNGKIWRHDQKSKDAITYDTFKEKWRLAQKKTTPVVAV